MPLVLRCLAFLLACCASLPAWCLNDAELNAALAARFQGDRSGVCVLAAVIDAKQVSRARFCANPPGRECRDGGPSFEAAFEIGSVSKTMTAFLVADLIDAGRWSLDDPIAKHLPEGTVVPRQGERQILLRDLLTHSAGLPRLAPGVAMPQRADPYATHTEGEVLAALGRVQLNEPIGSKSAYSNFGMMVVSIAVARAWRNELPDLDAVLRQRLFGPLGMRHSYINAVPAGQVVAQGHVASGTPTPAWRMATNLAGVGMVHATLDDMVTYTRASLGLTDTPLRGRLRATHQPLAHGHGMNWFIAPVQGRNVVQHGGVTGGFNSMVAMLPEQGRGVVLLADTDISANDGLTTLAHSLLGLGVSVPTARLAQPIPPELLVALPGHYELAGLHARVWVDEGHMMGQADGQPAFELLYDSRGDFYLARQVTTRLRPILENGEVNRFTWRQGGVVLEGTRQGHAPALGIQRPEWQAWAGEYRINPRFAVRVYELQGRLKLQGTAQPAIDVEVTGPDRIEAKAVGAVLEFHRNDRNEVIGATLRQNGQVLPATRSALPGAAKAP